MTACVLGSKISSGAYGSIYQTSGSNSVIKLFAKDADMDSEINSTAEFDILMRLRSPYLIEGLGVYDRKECGPTTGVGIRMERLIGTCTDLSLSNAVSYATLKRLTYHYALGLRCLHDNNYLHLDIAAANALYGKSVDDPVGKLIDFGLAEGTTRDLTGKLNPIKSAYLKITGTYRPIEAFTDEGTYSDKSDIWSLGMLIFELLSRRVVIDYTKGRVLYADGRLNYDATAIIQIKEITDPKKIEQNILARLDPVSKDDRIPLVNMLAKMLDWNVEKRYNIQQVITDPFFANMKEPDYCNQVKVAPLSPAVKFNEDRYQGLQYLITELKAHFEWAHTEFLFLCLDVYMRVIAGMGPLATLAEYKTLALTSLFIGAKIYYTRDVLSMYRRSPAWAYEGTALKLLNGIIRRPYLYNEYQNMDELVRAYKEIFGIKNLDNLDTYLRIDISAYVQQLRKTKETPIQATMPVLDTLTNFWCHISKNPCLYNLNLAYKYMLDIMHTYFGEADISVYILATDIFLKSVTPIYNPRYLFSIVTDSHVNTLQQVGLASIILAYNSIYQNNTLSTFNGFSIRELPGVWKIVDLIPKVIPSVLANPFYKEAKSLKELQALKQDVLTHKDASNVYTIFDMYPNLNPVRAMTDMRRRYGLTSQQEPILIPIKSVP